MPADPLDLAEIELLKDTMLAEYHVRNLRWSALQVGGLGIVALGLAGFVNGTVGRPGLATMLAAGILLIGNSAAILWWTDRDYEAQAMVIKNRLRSLKRGPLP